GRSLNTRSASPIGRSLNRSSVETSRRSDHPVCAFGASTPPLRGGECCAKLPEELQPELNLAWSGIGCLVGSECRGGQDVLESSKAGVVEYVEEVRTELNFDVLSQRRVLHDDPIKLCQSVQAKIVPAKRPVLTEQRLYECITTRIRVPLRRSRVDPTCGRCGNPRRFRRSCWSKNKAAQVSRDICSNLIGSRVSRQGSVRDAQPSAGKDVRRKARLCLEDPVEGPTVKDLAAHAREASKDLRLEVMVDYQARRNLELGYAAPVAQAKGILWQEGAVDRHAPESQNVVHRFRPRVRRLH